MPLLLLLLLLSCSDPGVGLSSLRPAPIHIDGRHEPDPDQVLKDVDAIVDGMYRAHGRSSVYAR